MITRLIFWLYIIQYIYNRYDNKGFWSMVLLMDTSPQKLSYLRPLFNAREVVLTSEFKIDPLTPYLIGKNIYFENKKAS